MKHFLLQENVGIIANRTTSTNISFNHVFISANLIDVRYLPDFGGAPFIFPLYLYPDEREFQTEKIINFTEKFRKFINSLYAFQPTSEQILGYIYAILYAPAYRTKYHEFLKIDFPRVPFTENETRFLQLSEKGTELINLHLLKTDFDTSIVNFPVEYPGLKVETVKFDNGKLWINKSTYFDNVPENVWNYEIGGYRVLDKWLKERKKHDYTLTGDDVQHVINVCDVLNETIRIQKDIDEIVRDWI
jgi:predicted helicase